MLKKLITILTYILLFLIVAVVLYNEGCLLSGGETAQMRDIPQIEQAQMRALESQSQHSDRAFLTFSFEGYALPLYDAARDCYLICESMLDQISVAQNIRCDVFMTRTEHGAQILAQKGADCRIYSFETTPLPILFLETGRPDAQPIGEQESSCLVTVLDAETGHLTQQTATIKIRGGLSRQYPKTGALIKLIDTRGKEVRATLAGLPENTEFALNSLYEDDSKMRDIAALSLWKAISTQDRAPGYELEISFEMTEVFINGAYAGLYGLHENVNLASFDLADRDGFSIFKSKSHATNRWEDGELYAESWGDVELKESNAQDAWSFFEEAFARMFYRLAGEGEQQGLRCLTATTASTTPSGAICSSRRTISGRTRC